MRICVICGARWRGSPSVCPLDGGELNELPDELLGRNIGGRYVITERIGAGGMGTVYRARHEVVGRDVAIKFLAPNLAMDPTNRSRFLREAKAANRIDHEHIIDITDFGESDDGLVYLVMEYLEGETLAGIIDRGPMPAFRAVEIAKQMASALARAHELDVVHRDIKPDNVFLLLRDEQRDFVKLLDFGLAKMQGEIRLTATGAVFGTPEYMAPEQAKGSTVTGSADLYALGCVLYEMLTSEPPFSGATPDLILKHLREAPEPPSRRAKSVPFALDTIVLRLLEKDPARRYVDAYHLLEDLRALDSELEKPRVMPTIRDRRFFGEAGASQIRVASSQSLTKVPDSWQRRIEHFRELADRAHPDEWPAWLSAAIVELQSWVDELAQARNELENSASNANEQEGEVRESRLQLGNAIDVLGRDESRAMRRITELSALITEAKERQSPLDVPLLDAWRAVPAAPEEESLENGDSVRRLRDAGQLASVWIEARRAVEQLERDLAVQERERDDLRFQIGQLKGRLATLSAEKDMDLAELRARSQRLEADMQQLIDRIASRAEEVVKHFSEIPELEDAIEASR